MSATPEEQALLDLNYGTVPQSITSARNTAISEANVMARESSNSCSIVGSLQTFVDETSRAAILAVESVTHAVFQAIANVTKKLNDYYTQITNKVTNEVNNKVQQLQSQLQTAIDEDNANRGPLATAIENIRNAVNAIGNFLGNVASVIGNAVTAAANAIAAVGAKLGEVVNTVGQALCHGTAGVLETVGGGIGGAAGTLANALNSGRSPVDAVKDVHSTGAVEVASTQTDALNNQLTAVSNQETSVDSQVPTLLTELDTAIA